MDEQLGAANEIAIHHLELERLGTVGTARLDPAVRVQRGRNPERVPGAVPNQERPPHSTRCGVSTAENGFSILILWAPGSSTSACASWSRR